MTSTYRFLDITSSTRNRTLYPLPTDFIIPVTNGPSNRPYSFLAQDPVCDAAPLQITNVSSVVDSSNIIASTGPTINDYYAGDYLQTDSGSSIINSYDSTTLTYNLKYPLTSLPSVGSTLRISKTLPMFSGNIATGATGANPQIVINLGNTVERAISSVGNFIYVATGPAANSYSMIASSTGTYVSLAKPLSTIPNIGDNYQILQYSYDNLYPLAYPGTIGFNQPVCYAIGLLNLIIPNVNIRSGYGGTFSNYPYLYVKLFNEGNMHAGQTLYTNNPAALTALFKVPIGLNLQRETFFCLKDCRQVQVVKWKPNEPLRFTVTFPDGTPIIFEQPDTVSPLSPLPLLQVSATFSIRRLDGDFNSR